MRIGVLVNELDGVYQSDLLGGLYRAAADLDVKLLCLPGSELGRNHDYRHELQIAYHMAGRIALAGIVSLTATYTWGASPEEMRRFFGQFGDTPVVSVGNAIPGIPAIKSDNRPGMIELIDHLLHYHRFRRIAFVAGHQFNIDSRERLAVFRERCALAGVEVDEDLILRGDFEHGITCAAIARLIASGKVPEAIVAANDEMGIAALTALTGLGLRVPEDVAVCGFDDLATILYDGPPLSSVQQDVAGQAELALRQLVAHLRSGVSIPAETLLPTRAVVRHSCGCSGLSSALPHALLWQRPASAKEDLMRLRRALQVELEGEAGAFHAGLAEAVARKRVVREPLTDLLTILPVLYRESRERSATEVQRATRILFAEQVWLAGQKGIHTAAQVLERVFPPWLLSDILPRLPSTEFSLGGMLAFLREGLVALGVQNGYLVLFSRLGKVRRWDDCDLPDESQLVLAIRNGAAMSTSDFERFGTTDLLPFPLFDERGAIMYGLLPIFQRGEHYGYLLLDIGTRYNVRVEQLREAIANLVTGTFVIGELDRARELLRQDLDRMSASQEQLVQLAERDELTGLLNRRGFLRRWGEMRQVATLLLVSADMDGLKAINDTWGPAAGDEAIQAFATVLRGCFRSDDLIARFGGDEFVVLTKSFGADTEEQVRERLRKRIAKYNEDAGKTWRLAASLGLVVVEGGQAGPEQSLLDADRKLYDEKRRRKEASLGAAAPSHPESGQAGQGGS
ncbi:GGDEF domain-containing protein [Niveibacterium sp. SC-1]|uniref:GGDEF domain-containing protein n=1 Tax=Niveibacterium sp. SC-1 TaxID=3135646 RepID=UPI00311EAED6